MRKFSQISLALKLLFASSFLVVMSYILFPHFLNSDEKKFNQREFTKDEVIKNYKSHGVPNIKRNPSSYVKNGIYSKDVNATLPLSNSSSKIFNTDEDSQESGSINSTLETSSNESSKISEYSADANEVQNEMNQDNDEIDDPLILPKDQDQNSEVSLVGSNTTPNNGKSDKPDSDEMLTNSGSKNTGTSGQITPAKIRGSIPPLAEFFKTTHYSPLINSAFASPMSIICSSPILQVFDLTTMTVLADNPISIDSISNETNFEFNPIQLNIDITRPTLYFLRTKGCNYTFERIVTNFYEDQDITQASTLISQIVKTQIKGQVDTVDPKKVEALISSLEKVILVDELFDDTYNKFEASTIGSDFTNVFTKPPLMLKNSLPDIKTLSVPSIIGENAVHNFIVETYTHWSNDYVIGYEWYFDDLNDSDPAVLMSNNSTWVYTPSKNHSNNFKITLLVGKKKISGEIEQTDTDIPFHEFSWTYPDAAINSSFLDLFPVTAPDLALESSQLNPTKNLAINLEVDTGSSLVNCESISNFVITQNATSPNPSDFNKACSSDISQLESLTLLDDGDGDRTLYIWAIDTNGFISPSKSVSINVDQTAPIIDYIPLSAAYRADTSTTLNWTISEAHSLNSINHKVELLQNDGITWDVLTSTFASFDGTLVNQNFSYTFTLPDRSQTNAKYRITLSDSLGNTRVTESAVFEITKPILATSPSSYDFGDIDNNTNGPSQIFTISNTGTGATKNCIAPTLSGANALEFEIVTDNCNTLNLAASSSCTYSARPIPTSRGAKTATIIWSCDSDTTSTTLNFNSINVAPTAASDKSISTNEDTAINFNVNAGSDSDSDSLTYTIVSSPAHGTLSNCLLSNADLNCDYTPNLNYNGTDSFTYIVNDGFVNSSSVTTVTITINAINDAPTLATTQSISTNEDTPLSFDLTSGSDIEGNSLSYIIVSTPASGGLICTGGTSTNCTYTPALNYNGSTTFTYKVNDGNLDSTTSTVTITINPINDAPIAATDFSVTVRDNLLTTVTLNAGSDIDTAAGSLNYKITQAPLIGTLSNCITSGGYTNDLICDYIAPINTNTSVTVKYIVNDGSLDSSNETTLTINIEDKTSTIPSLNPQNFSVGVSTNSNPMRLTAANCTDIAKILIKEDNTTPLASDPLWQNCSTVAGAILLDPSITNTQGFRTMRIFGIDAVGNISTYDSIDFIYDSVAPIIAIDDVTTLPWGIDYNIKWKLTEATISSTSNQTIEVSYNNGSTWATIASVSVASNGPHSLKTYSYTYTVPSGAVYNNVSFKISVTDDNGMTGTSTSNVFRIVEDLGAPFIYAGTFKVNGSINPPATSVKYVNISFGAEDIDTVLTHFCLKGNDTTAPGPDDACWKAFDAPSPGLPLNTVMNVTDFSYLLGFSPENFKISIWVRDLAGNPSVNSDATAGKDFVIMNYTPDPAPIISGLFVTNSNSPNSPVQDADLTFDNSDIVYISWQASDDKVIPSGTVSLSYTTDDINFTPIPEAIAIDNGINNCSTLDDPSNPLDDSATGCFKWTFPLTSGQYFKINIILADSSNQETSTTSVSLNSNKFKILAGNVDPGTGSSAKSAQLFPKSVQAPYSLAVSTDGKIFFNDSKRGILYINPYTNVLEQLLPVIGTSSGDGGPVTSATATNIHKINMDYQDRLLVWDQYALRRIDTRTNPMTIETIIGYKTNGTRGTNRSDTVLDPLDFKLEAPDSVHMFQPLPNGDIWFADVTGSVTGNNNLIRIYKGSQASPRIESIRISGTGGSTPPNGASVTSGNNSVAADLALENIVSYQITFDAETSEVTSLYARYYRGLNGCSWLIRENIDVNTHIAKSEVAPVYRSTCVDSFERTTNDGSHWLWSHHSSTSTMLAKYNPLTNSVEATKLGSGVHGTCVDGTPATSCALRLQDFYVASDGTFFFLDSNTIRVIDSAGDVQTLYGQSRAYGDGGLGQDARFGNILYIDHGVGDNVIVGDTSERNLREIRPNETVNQMYRLAGDGTLAYSSFSFAVDPKNQMLDSASWSQRFSFATNPANGDVYYACTWHTICHLNRASGLWEQFMGTDGGTHWTSTTTDAGSSMDMGGYAPSVNGLFNGKILTGHYDWSGTTSRNSILRLTSITTGQSEFVAGKAGENNGASGCPSGIGTDCNVASNYQDRVATTWDSSAGKILMEFEADRGAMTFRYLSPNSITTAFSYPIRFSSMVKVGTIIYGCTESADLVKWDLSDSSVVTLPIPGTAKCHGVRILYKGASGLKPARLVFPFNQNGLEGVAEYFLN